MGVTRDENLVERALGNISAAWREIAQSAARTIGLADGGVAKDASAIEAMMRECLDARGGEVSARMRAADLGQSYLELDREGRQIFLEVLAKSFDISPEETEQAIIRYQSAEEAFERLEAERQLRQAVEPKRVKLLTQFNALPEGVKFLVDLRSDLLSMRSKDPYLAALDDDLRSLLTSWFDVGFLDLRRITWKSPAALLEKLIAYEAVHEIQSWDDLRNRLDSDRRCYALFHPRMPDEPLTFVEVALVKGTAKVVQALLDEMAPVADPKDADTAIFYSISNTQKGLRGVSFGEHLIKGVVAKLSEEMPGLKTFATLSPLPRFRDWLDKQDADVIASAFGEAEQGGLRALGGSDALDEALRAVLANPDWHQDPVTLKAIKEPILRLGTRYLLSKDKRGRPVDPVAHFHLKNGARLEHLNWLADTSENGLRQSAGLMVNYFYLQSDIEKNHEAYLRDGTVVLGAEVKALRRGLKNFSESPLKRLGIG